MLNLAKALCLLLVATATGMPLLRRSDPATLNFDKAIKSTLVKIKQAYLDNVNRMTEVKINLRWKLVDLVPGLLDLDQPEFFIGKSIGSFIVDESTLRARNVKIESQVIKELKDHIDTIDNISNSLEESFHRQREFVELKQVSGDACLSSYPDTFEGRMQAASCLNELAEVLPTIVEEAELQFWTLAERVKTIANTAFENLELRISTYESDDE